MGYCFVGCLKFISPRIETRLSVYLSERVVKSFQVLFGGVVFMCRVGCECGGI